MENDDESSDHIRESAEQVSNSNATDGIHPNGDVTQTSHFYSQSDIFSNITQSSNDVESHEPPPTIPIVSYPLIYSSTPIMSSGTSSHPLNTYQSNTPLVYGAGSNYQPATPNNNYYYVPHQPAVHYSPSQMSYNNYYNLMSSHPNGRNNYLTPPPLTSTSDGPSMFPPPSSAGHPLLSHPATSGGPHMLPPPVINGGPPMFPPPATSSGYTATSGGPLMFPPPATSGGYIATSGDPPLLPPPATSGDYTSTGGSSHMLPPPGTSGGFTATSGGPTMPPPPATNGGFTATSGSPLKLSPEATSGGYTASIGSPPILPPPATNGSFTATSGGPHILPPPANSGDPPVLPPPTTNDGYTAANGSLLKISPEATSGGYTATSGGPPLLTSPTTSPDYTATGGWVIPVLPPPATSGSCIANTSGGHSVLPPSTTSGGYTATSDGSPLLHPKTVSGCYMATSGGPPIIPPQVVSSVYKTTHGDCPVIPVISTTFPMYSDTKITNLTPTSSININDSSSTRSFTNNNLPFNTSSRVSYNIPTNDSLNMTESNFPSLKPRQSSIAQNVNQNKSQGSNLKLNPTPSSTNSSYAGKIGNEVIVKKEQGIILHSGNSDICAKIPNVQLIKAVGNKIGPKNIISASRISNGRFCMFLKTEQIASSFVHNNPQIIVNQQNIYIRQYANSAEKLIISNVSTPIPNFILESILKAHLHVDIVSPIHHMSYGLIDKDYAHLTNFRRYVFVKYDADSVSIPESIVFDYDKLSYQIYLTVESNRCRICPDEYHTAKRCPKTGVNLSERLNKPEKSTEECITSEKPSEYPEIKNNSNISYSVQEGKNSSIHPEATENTDPQDSTEVIQEENSKMLEDSPVIKRKVELSSGEENFEVVTRKSKSKKKKKNKDTNKSNEINHEEKRPLLKLQDFIVEQKKSAPSSVKYDEYKEIMIPLKSIIDNFTQNSSEPFNINISDVINILEDCKGSRQKNKIVEAFKIDKIKLGNIFTELLNTYAISNKLKNRLKSIQSLLLTSDSNKLPYEV